MTGQELLDLLSELVGEEVDPTLGLILLNAVKDLIESERPWEILKKEDESLTFTPSDTYLTAKTLPSGVLSVMSVILGDASGASFSEYDPIPFEKRRLFKNSQKYYIDWANKKLHICGSVSQTYTIYLNYIYETDAIIAGTEPVWPTKFHPMIAYLAAEIYQAGIDADDITLRQALSHSKQGTILYNAMVGWDANLKLKAMGHSTPLRGSRATRRTDVIDR